MTGRKQVATLLLFLGVTSAALFVGKEYFHDELFPIEIGSSAPEFRAATLDATPTVKTLADYRGHVVLLNIWATWCLPCRVEMPSIEALHQSYAAQGLKVVAVSIDEPGTEAQIREFTKNYKLTFDILHDPKGLISKQYGVTGYPETFILGRDGIIRKKLMAATDWNSPENRALVERLLGERSG